MVGRKTSHACSHCRRRKVRCDFLRPSCSQCIRSRVTCPGYDVNARFLAVYPSRKGRRPPSALRIESHSGVSSNPVLAVQWHQKCLLPASPTNSVDALRDEFVFKVTNRRLAARFVIMPEELLLEHITQRIGNSRALDAAVVCVCGTRQSRETSLGSINTQVMAGSAYVTALKSLQSSLTDVATAVSSETLAAATLLQMYEHFADQSRHEWVLHANGVIKMLELRGPSRIRNDLERSILQAQVGNIVSNAVRDRRECFLAQPKWRKFLNEFPKGDAVPRELSATLNIGVHLPGLINHYERQSCSENSDPITGTEEKSDSRSSSTYEVAAFQTQRLAIDLYEARRQLQDWSIRFESDFEKPDGSVSGHGALSPLQCALRLSVNIFFVFIDYMLVETLCKTNKALAASANEERNAPSPDIASMSEQCATFASKTKSLSRILLETDPSASASTTVLHQMMLTRILETPRNGESEADCLRPVLEDLFNHLKDRQEIA